MSNEHSQKALLSQSQGIFDKFCKILANADLGKAAAIAMGVATSVMLTGVGLEVQHQSDLLASGGIEALNSYKELCSAYGQEHSFGQLVKDAFSGTNPSGGGGFQAIGFAGLSVAPAATMGAIMLARGLEKVKDWASSREPEVQAATKFSGPGMG